ncbi:hypothetical protein [Planotetraspora sp. GP83]|uniref:hypothetical protein n=1 Tax=Planotetraspora sp. GP83 TaxID=3156264 RepID=UPI003518DB0A
MSTKAPAVIPVDPAGLTGRHIIRVSDGEEVTPDDLFGWVRAAKLFGDHWRVRWDAAVVVDAGQPATGVMRIPAGQCAPCISRAHWEQLPRRLPRSIAPRS